MRYNSRLVGSVKAGGPLKIALSLFSLAFVAVTSSAQQPSRPPFTDAVALLQQTARTYTDGADSFRVESIIETVSSSELRNEWSRTYRTAIKGPGKLYRIEARTDFGSYVQVSDGVNEWVYQVESNRYVRRPLPQNWPEFPKIMDAGLSELRQAWDQRIFLENQALGYKRGTLLPEETIVIQGQRFPCYVVQVNGEDRIGHRVDEGRSQTVFWIDKQDLIFRKIRRSSDTVMMVSKNLKLPYHGENTELYPVVELNPKITPEMFRFTPPSEAVQVASLAPEWDGPPAAKPTTAGIVGQIAPDVTMSQPDGKKVALSSYRGKPVLIDFWATWCGPCLVFMPSFNRIHDETKDKGLVLLSIDENENPDDGNLYFTRHHYGWTNYHDSDKKIRAAFKGEGIPMTVLLDGQGKVVYSSIGGDEAELRKAIASLGPEFASVSH
jgi:thiol-disulfide isomerase/thioredoxin